MYGIYTHTLHKEQWMERFFFYLVVGSTILLVAMWLLGWAFCPTHPWTTV